MIFLVKSIGNIPRSSSCPVKRPAGRAAWPQHCPQDTLLCFSWPSPTSTVDYQGLLVGSMGFLGFSMGFLGFSMGFLGFSMGFLGFSMGFLGFSMDFVGGLMDFLGFCSYLNLFELQQYTFCSRFCVVHSFVRKKQP